MPNRMRLDEALGGLHRDLRAQPRFPAAHARDWCREYRYPRDDTRVMTVIGPEVRARGCFTRAELLEAAAWKSGRRPDLLEVYSDAEVRALTRFAFEQTSERLRFEVLCGMSGVRAPMASVFLHVGLDTTYPIIDYRALWSLHSGMPSSCPFELWSRYVGVCRALAQRLSMNVRDLDKALWAFSKANQPS